MGRGENRAARGLQRGSGLRINGNAFGDEGGKDSKNRRLKGEGLPCYAREFDTF